jgi:putative FmdB family regulatory protein
MPIYEYECAKCGRIEEALQKFSDKPLTKCHHCSGKLHRLVSRSSFHLKGTGWYVTDYAGKSRKSNASPKVKGKTDAPSGSTPPEKTKTTEKSDS